MEWRWHWPRELARRRSRHRVLVRQRTIRGKIRNPRDAFATQRRPPRALLRLRLTSVGTLYRTWKLLRSTPLLRQTQLLPSNQLHFVNATSNATSPLTAFWRKISATSPCRAVLRAGLLLLRACVLAWRLAARPNEAFPATRRVRGRAALQTDCVPPNLPRSGPAAGAPGATTMFRAAHGASRNAHGRVQCETLCAPARRESGPVHAGV